MKKLLNTNEPLHIPSDVAICPYCGSELVVEAFTEFELEDNETDRLSDIELECITVPDVSSKKYNRWLKQHTNMPYVYWHPVIDDVIKWINDNFYFPVQPMVDEQEKLERWNKGLGVTWQIAELKDLAHDTRHPE